MRGNVNYYVACKRERCIFCQNDVRDWIMSGEHYCKGQEILTVGVCGQNVECENTPFIYIPFDHLVFVLFMCESCSVEILLVWVM